MPNNLVRLIGIIGGIRPFKTKEDKDAISLSLGTRNSYKDESSGEWKDRKTVWHNDIFAFSSKMVEHCRNFQKDDLVELEGELEYRKVTDQQGNKKSCASIIIKKLERRIV